MELTRKTTVIILFLIGITFSSYKISETLYQTKTGKVSFSSDAPLEMIKATSNKLAGVLKIENKSFAFLVQMSGFEGFMNALQKEHFNENYIESDKYPKAKFEGKIIEDVDFSKDGSYKVRAKGKFSIHGVEESKTIKCSLTIKGKEIKVKSKFTILLGDYGIKIPSVVNQKIAEEIIVDINMTLLPR
jgi:polyisoprenoid-binding protein YceI